MGKRIINDLFLWIAAVIICLIWRVITSKEVVIEYLVLFLVMVAIWIVCGLIFQKYRHSYRDIWYWQKMLSMILTGTAVVLITRYGLVYLSQVNAIYQGISMRVVYWVVGMVMALDAMAILMQHYWKFALNMTVPVMEIKQRENAQVKRKNELRSENSIRTIHESVCSITTEEDYQLLLERANLNSRTTKVVANRDRFSFMQIPDYEYDTLVDLTLLNDAKGINKRFCIVNQKLPDNGHYVCCYRPQEYVKEKILKKYPSVLNRVVYFFWFIYRRILPKLLLTSRIYYDITKGRKRTLSKTEVLGRLYYCGFEVDDIVRMGHIEYVFAHRHSQPFEQEQLKVYGPLIKLPRISKDKEIVYFYKMRTMHPYSEYIQKYIFDQQGGMNIADKGESDWRITHWGRFMRRYWMDELPMLINWLKGDVKLVGIRPLSRAMFETYPKELQDKRTRCKPGLIPPFYIDHPKTFDELCASENKYLDEYFKHPFLTDTKYFFLTVQSILFKKMHSA